MNDEIEWRDIPGYEGIYQVSNTGLVKSLLRRSGSKGGKIFSTKPSVSTGYVPIMLRDNGRKWQTHIHRLVMLAFAGECPEGLQVNHKNGIRHDNRLENLEYVTVGQNLQHSIDFLGRKPFGDFDHRTIRGERHGNAKLDDDKVREIRRLYANGVKPRVIKAIFKISSSNVGYIVARKTWTHVE
jgi:hypothetical protein